MLIRDLRNYSDLEIKILKEDNCGDLTAAGRLELIDEIQERYRVLASRTNGVRSEYVAGFLSTPKAMSRKGEKEGIVEHEVIITSYEVVGSHNSEKRPVPRDPSICLRFDVSNNPFRFIGCFDIETDTATLPKRIVDDRQVQHIGNMPMKWREVDHHDPINSPGFPYYGEPYGIFRTSGQNS